MSNNKGYNYYNKEHKSFVAEPELKEEPKLEEAPLKEEAPIEVIPEVAEEAKEEIKEIPEIKHAHDDSKVTPAEKWQGKVILITRDGCIAENINQPGDNRSFYGEKYLTMKIGDIVEF